MNGGNDMIRERPYTDGILAETSYPRALPVSHLGTRNGRLRTSLNRLDPSCGTKQ